MADEDHTNYQAPSAADEDAENGNRNGTQNDGNNAKDEPVAPLQAVDKIQVKFRDQSGYEVQFAMKQTTKLGKAMDAFSAKVERRRQDLRFLLDGDRIKDDDTPADHEMDDETVIDVFIEQIGGATDIDDDWIDVGEEFKVPSETQITTKDVCTHEATHLSTTMSTLNVSEAQIRSAEKLTVSLKDGEGYMLSFHIRHTTTLERLVLAFAARAGKTKEEMLVFHDGNIVNSCHSLSEAGVKDGDVLVVVYQARSASSGRVVEQKGTVKDIGELFRYSLDNNRQNPQQPQQYSLFGGGNGQHNQQQPQQRSPRDGKVNITAVDSKGVRVNFIDYERIENLEQLRERVAYMVDKDVKKVRASYHGRLVQEFHTPEKFSMQDGDVVNITYYK